MTRYGRPRRIYYERHRKHLDHSWLCEDARHNFTRVRREHAWRCWSQLQLFAVSVVAISAIREIAAWDGFGLD